MFDDRICVFYVVERLKGIVEDGDNIHDFLQEMIYNIGVDTINKREMRLMEEMLKSHKTPSKATKKRGRPKKNG
jgi:hypothetical protein